MSARGSTPDRIDVPVPEEAYGQRLDRFLTAQLPDMSRSLIQRLIDTGHVTVDGATAKPSAKLRPGQSVSVTLPASQPTALRPEPIPLEILYEDEHLIVINKPRGMVVHPAPGSPDGTLVNAVLAHCPDELSRISGEDRPGIVHRLDKDTSGLIAVAKTDLAHRSLAEQVRARTAERRYLAVVWGQPRFQKALVDAPIGRHPTDRKRMAVLTSGPASQKAREASTELEVRERLAFCALLEARLHTGRTHQIRVHCAHIGHPVVGDPVYGGIRRPPNEALRTHSARQRWEKLLQDLGGQALHAYRLSVIHPITNEQLTFEVGPPADMTALIQFLREIASGAVNIPNHQPID
ncbi:MAG: RluA family pseudouridine synthase [Armatimonadota bacterium]